MLTGEQKAILRMLDIMTPEQAVTMAHIVVNYMKPRLSDSSEAEECRFALHDLARELPAPALRELCRYAQHLHTKAPAGTTE